MEQNPLLLWIAFRKSRSLEWIIKLGFEQDIYDTLELEKLYIGLAQVSKETRQSLIGPVMMHGSRLDSLLKSGQSDNRLGIALHGLCFNQDASLRDHNTSKNIAFLLRCYRYVGLTESPASPGSSLQDQLRYKHIKDVLDLEKLDIFVESGDGASLDMESTFNKAKDVHKEASEMWTTQRKKNEGNAHLFLAGLIKEWQEKVFTERGVRVLVDVGIAREKLRKIWQNGSQGEHKLVFPALEERKDAAWIVPWLEQKPSVV
jgi:hypothetical protein